MENASCATTNRLKLHLLLTDSQPGDVLLVEAIDRRHAYLPMTGKSYAPRSTPRGSGQWRWICRQVTRP
jgi:hypothetical protein